MTYRKDADISITYGSIKKKVPNLDSIKKEISANLSKLYKKYMNFNIHDNLKNIGSNIFNNSTAVAWMSSRCSTPGKREEYIRKLKKFIRIDIYG